MRVAAGVLLILAAVLNLFASLGYLGGGALTTGLGSVGDAAIEASMTDPSMSMSDAEAQEASEMSDSIKSAGGVLMGMGVLLLVSVGVLIAGAVFLFQSKQAKFATAAGVMALVCEGLGIGLSSFGVMNIIGLVGGVMAIIAARGYANAGAPEPAAA